MARFPCVAVDNSAVRSHVLFRLSFLLVQNRSDKTAFRGRTIRTGWAGCRRLPFLTVLLAVLLSVGGLYSAVGLCSGPAEAIRVSEAGGDASDGCEAHGTGPLIAGRPGLPLPARITRFALPGLPVNVACPVFSPGRQAGKEGCLPDPSTPAEKDSFFSKEYVRLLVEDTKHVFTAPARWGKKEWLTVSALTAGVAAVALADKPVWDAAQRNSSKAADNAAHILAKFGDIESLGIVVPFYVLGQVYDNPKARAVAYDGVAASMLAGGMISPIMKFIAGRSPPRDDEGTYTFHPFTWDFRLSGGAQSFPSGHAAQAFALGSVIASHYDEPWVKATAYSMSAVAGLSRVYLGYHFLSDWAAGSILGIAVGHAVVRFNEKLRREKKEQNVFLVPFIGRDAAGLSAIARF